MDECWNKVPHLFFIKLNWHSDSTLIIPSTCCLIVNFKSGTTCWIYGTLSLKSFKAWGMHCLCIYMHRQYCNTSVVNTCYFIFAACAESRGGDLGTGAVQAASAGCREGARGRDAAETAGTGAVQCLWGDDPPPGAGEGTSASTPGVCQTCSTFPWCPAHSRHTGPLACLSQHTT